MSRKGEKIGWLGGWSGGFVWVIILAGVFLFQGKTAAGILGLAIAACGFAAIWFFAPWRHPETLYRMLMIPIYVVFLLAVAWAVWGMEDPRAMGISGKQSAFLLLPLMLPMWTAGRRRWTKGKRLTATDS